MPFVVLAPRSCREDCDHVNGFESTNFERRGFTTLPSIMTKDNCNVPEICFVTYSFFPESICGLSFFLAWQVKDTKETKNASKFQRSKQTERRTDPFEEMRLLKKKFTVPCLSPSLVASPVLRHNAGCFALERNKSQKISLVKTTLHLKK